MGVISDSNVKTRAGSGSISIDPDDLIAGLPNTSAETKSLDAISVDYDLEEDSDKASAVLFDIGKLKFTMFDKLANGDSLFEQIDSLASTQEIIVEFSFTTNASRSWTDTFSFKPTDIEYDRSAREVSIEASFVQFTDTINDVFNDNPGDVESIFDGTDLFDVMPCNRYLENVMALFNSTNTVINDSFSYLDAGQTDTEYSFVVFKNLSIDPINARIPLYKMAVIEGSVVGAFLGYNFFVERTSTSNSVTISEDDVKDDSLKIDIGLNSYFAMRLTWASTREEPSGVEGSIASSDLESNGFALNEESLKRLDIFFTGGAAGAQWDAGNSRYNVITASPFTETGVFVDLNAKEGDTAINIDDGSGGNAPIDISDGDYIYFDSAGGSINVSPFYIADGANTSTQLNIKYPLIADVDQDQVVYVINSNSNFEPTTDRGVKNYASAYDAIGENKIKLSIFDIDTVKPYETITLDSSFPSAISGGTYRPSKLVYNFTEDLIEVEAYKIS